MSLLLLLLACGESDRGPECGKVICTAREYCRQVSGGRPDTGLDLPECATAPDSCGGRPRCDCLPDCTTCTEAEDGVYCEVLLP